MKPTAVGLFLLISASPGSRPDLYFSLHLQHVVAHIKNSQPPPPLSIFPFPSSLSLSYVGQWVFGYRGDEGEGGSLFYVSFRFDTRRCRFIRLIFFFRVALLKFVYRALGVEWSDPVNNQIWEERRRSSEIKEPSLRFW